jgi:CDP-glucose 4,6-dehydratase
MLEAIRAYHQKSKSLLAAIVASSDKAYGDKGGEPYDEKDPLYGGTKPGGPYEASKACTQILARCYGLTFQLPICVAALANVYGGGDMNFERRIPRTMRAIFSPTGDATVTVTYSPPVTSRDMLFIDDAVTAYRTLAERLVGNGNLSGHVFNFGSGEAVAEDRLLEMIARISRTKEGRTVKVESGLGRDRSMEILTQSMTSSKAQEILKWTASTKLEAGLESTYEWYKDFFNKATDFTDKDVSGGHQHSGVANQFAPDRGDDCA